MNTPSSQLANYTSTTNNSIMYVSVVLSIIHYVVRLKFLMCVCQFSQFMWPFVIASVAINCLAGARGSQIVNLRRSLFKIQFTIFVISTSHLILFFSCRMLLRTRLYHACSGLSPRAPRIPRAFAPSRSLEVQHGTSPPPAHPLPPPSKWMFLRFAL